MEDIALPTEANALEPHPRAPGTDLDPPHAWEMIENGRYQPRRIKGSCLGRELG